MADDKTTEPDEITEPENTDGAHPDNIPAPDSNEQLAVAHDKREAAFRATAAARRRKSAAADKPEAKTAPTSGRSNRPTSST